MRGLVVVAVFGVLLVPGAAQAAQMPSLAWSPAGGFGILDVGAGHTSKSITFTLTNSGGAATGALSISSTGSSTFKITANSCSGTSLGPGKKCSVTVKYTQTAAGQSNTATLTATSTKPAATTKLTLSGATGNPVLGWSRGGSTLTSYDFGAVDGVGGDTASQTFTLTNSGTGTASSVTAALGASSSSKFSIMGNGCSSVTLAPDGTCTVTVKYAPTVSGESDTGSLGAGGASLTLQGAGGSPSLALSPTTGAGIFNFGLVPFPNTVTQTFTLTNSGTGSTGTLGASSPAAGGNFWIPSGDDGCQGANLAPGASCSVTVAYTPYGPLDSDTDTLSAGGQSIALDGEGGFSSLSVNPGTFGGSPGGTLGYGYSFGAWSQGNGPTQTFTLTNTGPGTTTVPTLELGASSAFSIANDNCSDTTLADGGSCTFQVTYTSPSDTAGCGADATVDLSVRSFDLLKLELSGDCGTPSFAWSQGGNPVSSYDFGTVDGVGGRNASQTFTLTNGGTGGAGALGASTIVGKGFSITKDGCDGASLANSGPGSSCQVTVRWAPITTGESGAGTLTAGGQSISLSGSGGTPDLAWSPTTEASPQTGEYDFGNVAVGTTVTQTFTLTNSSSATGSSGSLSASDAFSNGYGDAYSLVPGTDLCDNADLAPGATCTVEIQFTPPGTGPGLYGADLSLDNAPGLILDGYGVSGG